MQGSGALRSALGSLIIVAGSALAQTQNIDLSTLPPRDGVQLTIYNSEDLTLVREARTLSFKQGINTLQFSWANTLIDPTSVELRFVSHTDQLELVDTVFPHGKAQMLYWNVESSLEGAATVQVSYFTSGISWSADYVVIADQQEQHASVESFVRVTNNSGEDYEGAQVRLVVGRVNLVEKIAELARLSEDEVRERGLDRAPGRRDQAVLRIVSEYDGIMLGAPLGQGGGRGGVMEKQVLKQGLSEYFIYTIEGTETIPNGWAKRLRSFANPEAPLRLAHRYRPEEYGEQLVRLYLMTNDAQSTLGETPLPDGVVSVFRQNDRGGLSYVTTQPTRYIPIGDKFELNLGPDPNVIFELIPLRAERRNLWMIQSGVNLYFRADGPGVQARQDASVAGWDTAMLYTQRIRNFTNRAIDVEVRRSYPGHVLFRSMLDPQLHDFRTPQYSTQVKPGERVDLYHEVVTRSGYNATQDNVTLEAAQVRP